MSYVKLICPSCNSKHEVSNYYIKANNITSLENLAKQLCTCLNIIEVSEITEPSDKELLENTIFNEKAFNELILYELSFASLKYQCFFLSSKNHSLR